MFVQKQESPHLSCPFVNWTCTSIWFHCYRPLHISWCVSGNDHWWVLNHFMETLFVYCVVNLYRSFISRRWGFFALRVWWPSQTHYFGGGEGQDIFTFTPEGHNNIDTKKHCPQCISYTIKKMLIYKLKTCCRTTYFDLGDLLFLLFCTFLESWIILDADLVFVCIYMFSLSLLWTTVLWSLCVHCPCSPLYKGKSKVGQISTYDTRCPTITHQITMATSSYSVGCLSISFVCVFGTCLWKLYQAWIHPMRTQVGHKIGGMHVTSTSYLYIIPVWYIPISYIHYHVVKDKYIRVASLLRNCRKTLFGRSCVTASKRVLWQFLNNDVSLIVQCVYYVIVDVFIS